MLLTALPLHAALVCYDEDCLPMAVRFTRTPDGLRVLLGGKYAHRTMLLRDGAWIEGDRVDELPKPRVARAETERFVYEGISFYEGEGETGRGGLRRIEKRTKKVELRRVPLLRHLSVNSIAADGDTVWFGTTVNEECIGQPPARGLVRYDWTTRATSTYEGTDDGPIGFVMHDIVVDAKTIWVATDLGLSRFDRATSTWHHFTPVEKDGRLTAPRALRARDRDGAPPDDAAGLPRERRQPQSAD